MREIERHVALDLINRKWIDHLDAMDFLREGIGLRGYAQRDPLIEYKREAFDLFQAMLTSVQDDMVRVMYRVQTQEPPKRRRPTYRELVEMSAEGPQGMGDGGGAVRAPRDSHCRWQALRKSRTQRSVPVRQRQEVQEVLPGKDRRQGMRVRCQESWSGTVRMSPDMTHEP